MICPANWRREEWRGRRPAEPSYAAKARRMEFDRIGVANNAAVLAIIRWEGMDGRLYVHTEYCIV